MVAATTHEAFSTHLNTKFQLRGDNSAGMEVELVKVSELLISSSQERFSIEFQGPSETRATQGTYTFEHEEIGTFDLFIVPIRQDPNGIIYEAVFNRFLKND